MSPLRFFFEEGLRRMQDLDGFRFEWEGTEYRQLLVEDLTADAQLFSFDICVEPKMIELTVAEKNSQAFLIIVFSFIKVFLSSESKTTKTFGWLTLSSNRK